MKKLCCINICTHKQHMNDFEKKSFLQAIRILWKYDFEFTVPEGLDMREYVEILKLYGKENYVVNKANPSFFTLIGFNEQIMLKKWFWDKFTEYEYVLHYELDAFVFRDEIELWCSKGYDYIGAPWMINFSDEHTLWKVGNGGFTLVKPDKIGEFLSCGYTVSGMWDSCLCVNHEKHFNIPSCQEAMKFSFEKQPSWLFSLNDNKLPFGCHKWMNYEYDSFWKGKI